MGNAHRPRIKLPPCDTLLLMRAAQMLAVDRWRLSNLVAITVGGSRFTCLVSESLCSRAIALCSQAELRCVDAKAAARRAHAGQPAHRSGRRVSDPRDATGKNAALYGPAVSGTLRLSQPPGAGESGTSPDIRRRPPPKAQPTLGNAQAKGPRRDQGPLESRRASAPAAPTE